MAMALAMAMAMAMVVAVAVAVAVAMAVAVGMAGPVLLPLKKNRAARENVVIFSGACQDTFKKKFSLRAKAINKHLISN